MTTRTIVVSSVLAAVAVGGSSLVVRKGLESSAGGCHFDQVSSKTFVAAYKGDVSALRALAPKDSTINQAIPGNSPCSGWRPLIIAAAEGKGDAVKILLDKGADPNVANGKGRTALMFAAHYGYASIVDELLNAGAHPDIVPSDGPKAIVAAGMAGKSAPIVSILRKGGTISGEDCEPNYRDGCVRIGMVMGSVLFDFNRAKEINEPLCTKGHKRSCGVVAASDCILRLTENGKTSLANLDRAAIDGCVREAAN